MQIPSKHVSMRLTPTQRQILAALSAGTATAKEEGGLYTFSWNRRPGRSTLYPNTINSLLERKLIEQEEGGFRITDLGKEALGAKDT